MSATPAWLRTLMDRYDPGVLQEQARRLRVALRVPAGGAWDVVLAGTAAQVVAPAGRPDAIIVADSLTWNGIVTETGGALDAYLSGRLSVRRNLHVGVAFLAATSGSTQRARMQFRYIATRSARLSIVEAGDGPPVLAVHGLGATKG